MPFNINDFLANLNKGGVAKSANYEVMIQRPFGNTSGQERDMMFRVSNCTTPGRRIETTDIQDYSMERFVGYKTSFEDVSMRILLSEDLREKEYFEEWLDAIGGNYRLDQLNSQMFDIGFYDDYALNTVVQITQFDATGEPTHLHILKEAYPISVGSLDGSWDADEIMYLDVIWKYRFYTSLIL
jgi:hypothetical protein